MAAGLLLPALCGVVACISAWLFFRRAQLRLRYDLHAVPGPEPRPIIGNMGSVFGTSYLHRVLAKWTTEYGPVFKWSLPSMQTLVVTDPEEVIKLSGRELNLPKHKLTYKPLDLAAPYHNIIATPHYEEWKYFRKMTNPAFSPENIRKAYPSIYAAASKAAKVLHSLSKQGLVDMGNLSTRATAEIINAVAFHVNLGALDYTTNKDGTIRLADQDLLQHSRTFQNEIALALTDPFKALLLFLCPWLAKAKKNKAARQALEQKNDELAGMIQAKGPQPESESALWACLSRFVNYKDGGPIPTQTIAANAGIFFAAGYETTAHAISWALFELSADENLQARVREELRRAGLVATPGAAPARPLDYTDLGKLKLLDGVIKETLRLHPTAPTGSVREADKDMVVMGYRIPKGTALMLAPYPMHTSPHNYIEPYKFSPERWLSEAVQDKDLKQSGFADATQTGNRRSINGSWNPFSNGPRNCIGQALAMAELRSVLAVFLANFFFKLPEGVKREEFIEEQEVSWVSLQIRDGLFLKVTPIVADAQATNGWLHEE